jgi:sulfonate transport system permease protein
VPPSRYGPDIDVINTSRRSTAVVLGVVGAALFVAAWEWTGRAGTFGRTWVPLSDIWDELTDPARRPLLERASRATFGRAALGLAFGFGFAALAASLASMVPAARSTVGRIAVSLNAIPWIALGPLLMVTVERNTAPAVIAALAVFFPAFTSIATGLDAVRRESLDLFTSLGAPRVRAFALLRAPGALPMLMVALKMAAPAALIGAIFGEWFGAERGLGLLLLTSMQNFVVAQLWAVAFLSAGVAVALYVLFSVLEALARDRFGGGVVDESPSPAGAGSSGGRLRSVGAWVALALGVLALWQGYVASTGISAILVPSPADVLDAVSADVGGLAGDALATLRVAAIGLVGGTAIGALLAILTWWSPLLRGLLTPVALVAHSVPSLALLPVIAGLFGYNDRSLVAIAVIISFFPGFVFTDAGLRAAPGGDLLRALGAGRARQFVVVTLPASLPHMAVALRISAGLCVIAAVVAQFMIGREGLGRRFSLANAQTDIALAWGVALVIVGLSMAAYAVAARAERLVHRRFA